MLTGRDYEIGEDEDFIDHTQHFVSKTKSRQIMVGDVVPPDDFFTPKETEPYVEVALQEFRKEELLAVGRNKLLMKGLRKLAEYLGKQCKLQSGRRTIPIRLKHPEWILRDLEVALGNAELLKVEHNNSAVPADSLKPASNLPIYQHPPPQQQAPPPIPHSVLPKADLEETIQAILRGAGDARRALEIGQDLVFEEPAPVKSESRHGAYLPFNPPPPQPSPSHQQHAPQRIKAEPPSALHQHPPAHLIAIGHRPIPSALRRGNNYSTPGGMAYPIQRTRLSASTNMILPATPTMSSHLPSTHSTIRTVNKQGPEEDQVREHLNASVHARRLLAEKIRRQQAAQAEAAAPPQPFPPPSILPLHLPQPLTASPFSGLKALEEATSLLRSSPAPYSYHPAPPAHAHPTPTQPPRQQEVERVPPPAHLMPPPGAIINDEENESLALMKEVTESIQSALRPPSYQ